MNQLKSMTVPCKELQIGPVDEPVNVVTRLHDAKESAGINVLHVHQVEFNEQSIIAVCDLLEHDDRTWDTISFIIRGERLLDEKPSDDAILSMQRLFGSTFCHTHALKSFRLTATVCDTSAALLAEGIRHNETIESLDLRWSSFEAGCITKLCEGLRSNKGLKNIDLSSCDLDDDEIAEIVSALQNHPSLVSLVLPFNNCGELGGYQISLLLESPSCRLRNLDLSFQQRDRRGKLVCHSVLSALKKNTSLHTLNLTCNKLDDRDAQVMAHVMAHNSDLQDLRLARNGFTDKGIKSIATELSRMKGLKSLSLWGNNFSENGAEALLAGMSMNTELHTLNLFRQFKNVSDKIDFLGNFNRVGRRLIHKDSIDVPLGLWPLLLERANTVKLSSRSSSAHNDEASCRAEIMYCSLQGSLIEAFQRY
jgi:Leucine Rich repeat